MAAPIQRFRALTRLGRWLRLARGQRARWSIGRSRTVRRQLAALRDPIDACGAALIEFGHISDADYTALARGVGALSESLTTLRDHGAAFQCVLEDRDADRPVQAAHEIYKRAVDLFHSSIGIALTEGAQLETVEASLLAACRTDTHFQQHTLMLRIITMRIRMEAAQMPVDYRETFLNVAQAVGGITERIATCTATAFQRIGEIVAEIRVERGQLHQLATELHDRAESSIHVMRAEVAALRAALEPCAAHGRDIAAILGETQPLIQRLITSLQHQDMVRQQLEHVTAGFRDLRQHLAEGFDPAHAAVLEPTYVQHIARVQQAHLQAARREIDQATGELLDGLGAVDRTGDRLLTHFGDLERTGTAAFTDFRIGANLRTEIQQLARITERSAKTTARTAGLVERIEDVVRLFADEIGDYEYDVRIVALNAQIAAARVPAAEALTRLAEETSRMADQNAAITARLLAEFRDSLHRLTTVKATAGDFLAIAQAEKTEMEAGLLHVTAKLERLRVRVHHDLDHSRTAFAAARTKARDLLQNLRLTQRIAATFAPADQLCTELLATTAAPDRTHSPLSVDSAARLNAHSERYTMRKEAATHEAALAAAPVESAGPAPVAAAAVAAPPDAGDLGDGIELF